MVPHSIILVAGIPAGWRRRQIALHLTALAGARATEVPTASIHAVVPRAVTKSNTDRYSSICPGCSPTPTSMHAQVAVPAADAGAARPLHGRTACLFWQQGSPSQVCTHCPEQSH